MKPTAFKTTGRQTSVQNLGSSLTRFIGNAAETIKNVEKNIINNVGTGIRGVGGMISSSFMPNIAVAQAGGKIWPTGLNKEQRGRYKLTETKFTTPTGVNYSVYTGLDSIDRDKSGVMFLYTNDFHPTYASAPAALRPNAMMAEPAEKYFSPTELKKRDQIFGEIKNDFENRVQTQYDNNSLFTNYGIGDTSSGIMMGLIPNNSFNAKTNTAIVDKVMVPITQGEQIPPGITYSEYYAKKMDRLFPGYSSSSYMKPSSF